MLRNLKKALAFLVSTPLHPQWLTRSADGDLVSLLEQCGAGSRVLDIGCFDKWPKRHLPRSARYIGLDYPETAEHWYESTPDLYGDGCRLPIADETMDLVLLLDVGEHIADTEVLLGEIRRVLKPGARLLMQMPFLYPLHDEPRDFVRYTEHGFQHLADKIGFLVTHCSAVGRPLESAFLLLNIALTKTALNLIAKRNPLAISAVLLVPIIPFNNLMAKLLSSLSPPDRFMPRTYQVVLEKPAASSTHIAGATDDAAAGE